MAQQNYVKLAAQGRSFDATRPWTEGELTALLALEEAGLARTVAADYVRNGIMTVAQYEKAKAVGFTPKSLEDLRADAIALNQKLVQEQFGPIIETEVVVEPEAEVVADAGVEAVAETVEAEVVVEPEAEVVVPEKKTKKGK